jgi:hypothetical protein
MQLTTVAAQRERDRNQKSIMPTHLVTQFAGNIGMFSGGPAWLVVNDIFEVTTMLGFVPSHGANSAIVSGSVKLIYKPKLHLIKHGMEFKPIAVGVVTNYSFGSRYNYIKDRRIYPQGYYNWSIYRSGFLIQSELKKAFYEKWIESASVYFEASFWDLYLTSFLSNNNKDHLRLKDIVTFGIGTKVFF